MKPISNLCPCCHKEVAFSWTYSSKQGGGTSTFFSEFFDNDIGRWMIGECPFCYNCILIHLSKKNSSDKYWHVELYPNPLPSPTNERIPEDIRKDLDEAKMCFSVNAFNASAVMSRLSIQRACKEKGATKKDLIDQVKELADNGTITSDLKDLADTIRVIGNDGAHPNILNVNKQDAKEVLELAEQLLEVIFVAPARVKEIKEKREKGSEPK